jgi:hypothetical protein
MSPMYVAYSIQVLLSREYSESYVSPELCFSYFIDVISPPFTAAATLPLFVELVTKNSL